LWPDSEILLFNRQSIIGFPLFLVVADYLRHCLAWKLLFCIFLPSRPNSLFQLSELPLELLDIILQYSIIHWTASCSLHQRQVDALKCLASVDFCWFQRIEKQRFKNKIQQRLRGRLHSIIIRQLKPAIY